MLIYGHFPSARYHPGYGSSLYPNPSAFQKQAEPHVPHGLWEVIVYQCRFLLYNRLVGMVSRLGKATNMGSRIDCKFLNSQFCH